ncbi:MAG TPA: metal ABC transporter ATP-binding protein [Patescibacteria group bacterium]|nr:metal ABC transporter ATP-binding protein [Patescibacteria group bacterium]
MPVKFVDHTKNIVEVKNVSYSYFPGNPVLKNISLNIHKGDYLGVVGPNGGGKSTLIKLILGLIKPPTGEINMFCKNIAYVGQKATDFDQKFPATVNDVVSMGRYSAKGLFKGLGSGDKKIVAEAIEQVGMSDYKDRLIGDLSGGQQQKTFIARALAQHPEIIFLDEPTSGVDQASQEQFYKILKQLNLDLGITLVLISHDVDVITQEVTEIAAVNQTLVFYGPSKEFIKEEHGIKFIHHTHD